MAEKLVFKVSPILAADADFKAVEDVESNRLDNGDTILVYPGTYSDPNTAFGNKNISIVGVGKRDDVEFTGFTIPSTFTGTLTLKGVSIASPGLVMANAAMTVNLVDCKLTGLAGPTIESALAWGNAAITKGQAGATYGVIANSTLVVDSCEFAAGAAYGILAHDYGTITVRNSRLATDAGIYSNGACTVEHSTFTGANNYVSTPADVITAPTHTVRASVSAAANAGNCVETVVALIS